MNNEEFLKKLGLKIKFLRTIKGLSQDDIALELEIDKSYYSKVERGIANTTIIYLKKLSDVLGVELTELFNFNF